MISSDDWWIYASKVGAKILIEDYNKLFVKVVSLEAEKAEAVRIAVKAVKSMCRCCGSMSCENEYADFKEKGCAGFKILVDEIERLTGKKWEDVNHE